MTYWSYLAAARRRRGFARLWKRAFKRRAKPTAGRSLIVNFRKSFARPAVSFGRSPKRDAGGLAKKGNFYIITI